MRTRNRKRTGQGEEERKRETKQEAQAHGGDAVSASAAPRRIYGGWAAGMAGATGSEKPSHQENSMSHF